VHIISHPVAASGLRLFIPTDAPIAVLRMLAKAKRRRPRRIQRITKRTEFAMRRAAR
jgi:hypothetical protein